MLKRINKLKSIVIFVVMLLWYILCYGIFWGLFLSPVSVIIALFIYPKMLDDCMLFVYLFIIGALCALLIYFVGFYLMKDKPYEISGCKTYQIDKSEYTWLYYIVQDIAMFYGLNNIPKLYFFESDILNIYSYGVSPESASIVISKGLLELLSEDELKSVIAHEISHITNRDIEKLFYFSILDRLIKNFKKMADKQMHLPKPGIFRGYSFSETIFLLKLPFLLVPWLFYILELFLFPINRFINSLCILFFKINSENNEIQADLSACLYTKKPEVLVNALAKIEESISKGKNYIVEDVVAASFIVPLMNDVNKYHPTTKKRIEMLLNVNSSCYKECEKEFKIN